MGRIEGKMALVAGAGGGIGGAGAEALAREGAAVLCADIDGTAAETTARHIRAAGGRAAGLGLDVRDRAAVEKPVAPGQALGLQCRRQRLQPSRVFVDHMDVHGRLHTVLR